MLRAARARRDNQLLYERFCLDPKYLHVHVTAYVGRLRRWIEIHLVGESLFNSGRKASWLSVETGCGRRADCGLVLIREVYNVIFLEES